MKLWLWRKPGSSKRKTKHLHIQLMYLKHANLAQGYLL